MPSPLLRRRTLRRRMAELRAAYDDAIAEAGVVMIQQTATGADSYHVSPSCTSLLGWDPAAFREPGTLRSIVHLEDLATFRTMASDLDGEAPVIRLRHADGTWRRFRFGVRDVGPHRPLGITLVDVTNDEAAMSRRRRSDELFDSAEDAILIVRLDDPDDPDSTRIEDLNQAAAKLMRRPGVQRLSEVFDTTSLQLIRSAAFDVAHTGESMLFDRMCFGELPERVMQMHLVRLSDSTVALRFIDITHQVEVEDELRSRAMHDQRTGLGNLAMLEEHMGHVGRGDAAMVALLAVELHGPHTDDHLIVEVARRLAGVVSTDALVARVGDHRLAVLVDYLVHPDELAALARTAAAAMAIPFDVAGEAVAADASIGAAVSPADSLRGLLADAELAARNAGARGRAWMMRSELTDDGAAGLFEQVRGGIGQGDMELRYQPIVDLRTGKVVKVEALLRWQNMEGQPPPAMLDVAERSGLVPALGRWMLGESAAAATRLRDSDDCLQAGPKVAVNLSSLGNGDELEGFLRLLDVDGITVDDRLEVEISETMLTDDPMRATELVNRLRSLGLSVVIDDFGAGFTSLSTVSGLALDGLKIDRSFIATLTSIPADGAVVSSTIEFCHQLGVPVTAVGVADEATLARLRQMGCDLAQGFLISEPVTIDRLEHRIMELEQTLV